MEKITLVVKYSIHVVSLEVSDVEYSGDVRVVDLG